MDAPHKRDKTIRCRGKNSRKTQCKRKILLSKNPNGYCNYHFDQDTSIRNIPPENKTNEELEQIVTTLKKKREEKKSGKKSGGENQEEEICVICQDFIKEKQIKLRCKHKYCEECISQIRKPVCPMCNKVIKKGDIPTYVFESITERRVVDLRKMKEEEAQASIEVAQNMGNLNELLISLISNPIIPGPSEDSEGYGVCIDFCVALYYQYQGEDVDLYSEECRGAIHTRLHHDYDYDCDFLSEIQSKAISLIEQ